MWFLDFPAMRACAAGKLEFALVRLSRRRSRLHRGGQVAHRLVAGTGYTHRRQDQLPKEITDIAWKAQLRLNAKFKRLVARRVMKTKAVVAVARELAGFVWAIGCEVQTSGWQGVKSESESAAATCSARRVATKCSVAFPVRQRVFIASVIAEGWVWTIDREKPYQRSTWVPAGVIIAQRSALDCMNG